MTFSLPRFYSSSLILRVNEVEKFLRKWNWAEKFIVGLLAFIATACTFYAAFMRYVFEAAPDWVEETVVYMIIWAVFLIASTLAEEKGHVGATFIVERLPLKARRSMAILTSLLALVFCLLISFWGYRIVYVAYIADERSLTAMRYPLWIAYLSVPVGTTLVAGRYMKSLYRLLFRFQTSDLLEVHELSREEIRS